MSRSRHRTAAALLLLAAAATLSWALAARGPRPLPRAQALRGAEAPRVAGASAPAPARDGIDGPLESLLADPADPALHSAPVGGEARGTVPELLRLLDGDAPRKDLLVRSIATRGGTEAWEGLLARLGNRSLRSAIEVALGEHAPPEVIDRLKREMLAAPAPATRASAVRVLGVTADRRHGANVRALLDRESEWEVRHAAIGALGRFGDAPSVETLVGLAVFGGREARTARLALLDVRDLAALEGGAARWPELDGETRFALLYAATEAPRARTLLPVATEALHDPDDRVRIQAVELLVRFGDDAVEPLLDHALRGASANETEGTLAALAGLATPRAAEAGLRAIGALPPRRQAHYRALFLATLGR